MIDYTRLTILPWTHFLLKQIIPYKLEFYVEWMNICASLLFTLLTTKQLYCKTFFNLKPIHAINQFMLFTVHGGGGSSISFSSSSNEKATAELKRLSETLYPEGNLPSRTSCAQTSAAGPSRNPDLVPKERYSVLAAWTYNLETERYEGKQLA